MGVLKNLIHMLLEKQKMTQALAITNTQAKSLMMKQIYITMVQDIINQNLEDLFRQMLLEEAYLTQLH